jgi:hypothetical protein
MKIGPGARCRGPLFVCLSSYRLNTHLLHLGAAFIVQWATGSIVDLWQVREAIHPAPAHQAAFAVKIAMQAAAMIWFVWRETGYRRIEAASGQAQRLRLHAHRTQPMISQYSSARREWRMHLAEANTHLANWRMAGIGMSALACVLASRMSVLAGEQLILVIAEVLQ